MRLDRLSCLSLSAIDGDAVEIREAAHLPPQRIEPLLREWLERLGREDSDPGLLYLGTCHRVELYAFGLNVEALRGAWAQATGADLHRARTYEGRLAAEHLVRVAASLESEVLGETQITGQVREAGEFARSAGLMRGPLDQVLQFALRVAKRIRSETRLSEGTVSVAHVAVDGLLEVFESLEDKSALLLGAGSMAEQALARLRRLGIGSVTWLNRTRSRIESSPLVVGCQVDDFEKRHALAWAHSITVAATSSEDPIIVQDALRAVSREWRKAGAPGPRVMLDLGLPRNVDERIHGYSQFYVRNVDEFSTRIHENAARRQSWLKDAERIVEEEVRDFTKTFEARSRGPLIGELFRSLEALRSQELAENKLEKNPEIDYLTRSITAKLMHHLVRELDSLEEGPAREVLEVLSRAWRQAAEWQPRKSLALDPKDPRIADPKVEDPRDPKGRKSPLAAESPEEAPPAAPRKPKRA